MQNADSMKSLDVLRLFAVHRRRIVICVMAGAAVGFLSSLLTRPMYKAEVLLVPVSHGVDSGGLLGLPNQLGGLASLSGVSLGNPLNDNNSSVAMLRSRSLARLVIEENDLLSVLLESNQSLITRSWKSRESDSPHSLWDAERIFSRKVRRVSEDRKTGLVTVTVVWSDPDAAAKWANDLVATGDRVLRSRAIDAAKSKMKYLQQQLDTTSILDVRQTIYQLLADQLKEIMLAQGGAEYAFKVLDPGVVPEEEIAPSTTLLVACGAFVGLLLACEIILMMRQHLLSQGS